MANKSFDLYETEEQFVISYELICLLKWLLEHDENHTKLKKIVSKALSSGLKDTIKQKTAMPSDEYFAEDIQATIIDFLGVLEAILLEATSEQTMKNAIENKLMPTIEKIDSALCDDATLRFSLEKATSKIEKNPNENPNDLLFQELLKRWKPNKKNLLN